jgi:hypothetical protein
MGGWDYNGSLGDWLGSMKWVHLAQDRDWWSALVNGGDEPSGSGIRELVSTLRDCLNFTWLILIHYPDSNLC